MSIRNKTAILILMFVLATPSVLAQNTEIKGPGQQPQQPNQQQPPQQSQQQRPSEMRAPDGGQKNGPQPNNPNPGANPQKDFKQQNPRNNPPNLDNKALMEQNPRAGNPQGNKPPLQDKQPGSNDPAGGKQKFQELSNQWQQDASKFGFQIKNPENPNNFPSISGNFNVEVQKDGKVEQLDLNDGNTRVSLGSFQAVRGDGTKVEIEKEAKEKINAAIKLVTGSEVSQNGNTFTVKRGDISAKTQLPISFNVATKSFTVQTPSGEQEVKVLPDEALEKIKEVNADFSADKGDVKLEEFNNEPVYQIPGQKKQKFLGFIPVDISQTSVVSAKDGNVVATNQSFVSRILDTISF